MSRTVNRLSARTVTALREPGKHADGAGLYLQIDKPTASAPDLPGAKRWAFIYQWQGKRKEMGFGPISLVSLADAREMANAARKQVLAGVDPVALRKAERARIGGFSFGEAADHLLESLEGSWKNPKHKKNWELSLNIHAAPLRPKAVAEINTEDVLDVLKPIWSRIPETASRTRGRIERVLDSAKAKGQRAGENPARWRGHLAMLLPKRHKLTRGHHPALPYAEIPAFMADLASREAVSARAMEFTIYTAARTAETTDARWSEVDLKAKLWTVPAARMKLNIEHYVPLTDAAIAALKAMMIDGKTPPATDYIFPGDKPGKPLSSGAMDRLLDRLDRSDITVHGFRSTFRDWAGDKTEHAKEVAEAALAHQVGNETEIAYRRGTALEKRRTLMKDWADYCQLMLAP